MSLKIDTNSEAQFKSTISPTAYIQKSKSTDTVASTSKKSNDALNSTPKNKLGDLTARQTSKLRPLTPEIVPIVAFKKAIMGDIFSSQRMGGDSLAGLMYRSRVIERESSNSKLKSEEKVKEETSLVDSLISSVEVEDTDSDSDNELKLLKRMNPKQQLALTIKNWSVSPENDTHLIKEGAVYALIALSSIDDTSIRRCCASSFYHLSSRAGNREELLAIGTTVGIVKLATLYGRSWKVAKLTSLTLCYLSMQERGEAIMATEGAIGALSTLLTMKGQSLLPVCVQALYNMTCAEDHFKELERIIKSLLNITSSSFDHSDFLVKALVNCSRYSWMRMRIIEDGALSCLNSLLPTITSRPNKIELSFNVLVALRSLSESSGCRTEMLQKGTVEILNNILAYCDDKGRLLIIRILHNFLQAPVTAAAMSLTSFETSVSMVANIVCETLSPITLQYCAACFHIFTREKIREQKHLSVPIIDSMTLLLRSNDPLTQFFSISTSGNIFFDNLCTNPNKVELLVKNFVQYGPHIKDPAANQALALALAKLSQEDSYMAVIEKLGLLKNVLELLMTLLEINKDSLLLQESCCIAICRIALKLDDLETEDKRLIAKVFVDMLETDDQFVLSSTISGIRALGSSGLCHKELLSETLLNRVANIVARYKNETELCRTGCAVLAVFSYDVEAHDMLAAENIMNVLFANINAEDGVTKELVANTLCNVSVNNNASDTMIKMGVVEVLATLASSTSETILELCAKCICNLTCNTNLHRKMIDNKVLEIILMISLVRTVNNSTKLICAKALLNLITDDNLPAIEISGSVRIFATLSSMPNAPIQHICAKGLYLFTLNLKRRQELVQRRAVLQALFNMVKCTSSRTRIKVGTSVCNLLACPITNKAAIRAGALAVIKIIATMDFEELREACARVIINLAQDPSLQSLLLGEPIVSILVLILQKSSDYTFECAIFALSCLSQSKEFKVELIDKGCVVALIGTIIAGKVATPLIAEEVCRCICHLSYHYDKAEALVLSGHLFLALHAIYLSGICSADTALLITLTMRNISQSVAARNSIIQQNAFRLLVSIITDFNLSRFNCTIMYSALVTFMYNLSLVGKLHEALLNQGFMQLLQKICLYANKENGELQTQTEGNNTISSPEGASIYTSDTINSMEDFSVARKGSLLFRKDHRKSIIQQAPVNSFESLLNFTHHEIDCISKTINLLSQTPSCHRMIVDGGVMKIFRALIEGISEASRSEIASSLANISSSKSCRVTLVEQGATELLIALSITSDSNTQSQCALALGYLSELTKVNDGVVASLLLLSLNLEEVNASAANAVAASGLFGNRRESGMSSMAAVASQLKKSKTATIMLGDKILPLNNVVNVMPETGFGREASQQVKTLQQMIKELVVDKRRFDQYLDLLRNKNGENLANNYFMSHSDNPPEYTATDTASFTSLVPPASKLSVSDQNKKIILAEESSMLHCDFENYKYDNSVAVGADSYSPESGGMSIKSLAELPLPGIPADRNLEAVDRHDELRNIPISKDPLPKNFTKPQQQQEKLAPEPVPLPPVSSPFVNRSDTPLRKASHENSPKTNPSNGVTLAPLSADSHMRRPLLRKASTTKGMGHHHQSKIDLDALPGAAWNKR